MKSATACDKLEVEEVGTKSAATRDLAEVEEVGK